MSKYIDAIRRLAKMKALDAESAEKLLNAHSEDGGPGSGNFGHRGRPGKKGGSAPRGGGGAATSATTRPSGTPSGQTVHFYNPKKPSFPGRRSETEKVVGRGNSELWEEVSRWTLPECPVHPPSWNSRGEYSYKPGTPEEERKKYEKYERERAAWEAKEAKKRGYKSFEEMKKDYDKKREKALEKAMKSSLKLTTTSPLSEPESNPYDYHREYNGPKRGNPFARTELENTSGERNGSSFHEKRSLATRDNDTLRKLQGTMNNPEEMKRELDKMKPGSMIRLDEKGYSVFMKEEDGSWTYRRYHGEPQKVSNDEVVQSAQKTGFMSVSAPKQGESGRSQYWDNIRAVARLEPNAGDRYTGKRFSFAQALKNGALRAKGLLQYPREKGRKSEEYTKSQVDKNGVIHSTGKPSKTMPKGTGVTKISNDDLMKPNPDDRVYNTLQEHCMLNEQGELVLTPEREKLHEEIIDELFADAQKPAPGEPKVMTFMGGGSAAGKGTIQKSGVAGLPDKTHSPVIDADEMKKRIPEYVDTAFSDDHNKAASMGHEESSALAKRAMDAAIANGYSFTLDGTGDGNPQSQIDKIKKAKANGYVVKGCYVTCPTEMAVKRNEGRSKTDEYNRLVPEREVRVIHSRVSKAFESVAKEMDECKLYDTSGDKPVLICEFRNGKKVFEDKKRYDAFMRKKAEEEALKLAEERKRSSKAT